MLTLDPKETPTRKIFGFGSGLSNPTAFGDLAANKSSFNDILAKQPAAETTPIPIHNSSARSTSNTISTDTLSTSPARVQMERLEVSSQISPNRISSASNIFPVDSDTPALTSNTANTKPTTSTITNTLGGDAATGSESATDSSVASNSDAKGKKADDVSSTTNRSRDSIQSKPVAATAEPAKTDESKKPTSSVASPQKLGFSAGLLAGRATEKESLSIFGGSSGTPLSFSTNGSTIFGGSHRLNGFGSVSSTSNISSFTSLLQSTAAAKPSSSGMFGGGSSKRHGEEEEDEGGEEDEGHAEPEEAPVELDPTAPAANLTPIPGTVQPVN